MRARGKLRELSKIVPAVLLVVLSWDPLWAQAPPIRGEGGNVQSFQGRAIRTFGRFVVLDTLRVEGEKAEGNGEKIQAYIQPFVVSYTPTPGLALRLAYPLVVRQFENFSDPALPSSVSGLGDLTLSAKYRFFFLTTARSRLDVAAISGIKLPTGSSTRADNLGQVLPRPAQPGTGSTDFFWQMASAYQNGEIGYSIFADVEYRKNTEARGFEFGDLWSINFGGQKRVLPARLTRLGAPELYTELAFQYQNAGRSRSQGLPLPDSGGTSVLIAPGMSLILKARYLIEASFQFPLNQDLNGVQLSQGWNLQLGTRILY